MGNFQLEWSIEGTKELSRMLLDVESRLRDFTPAFRDSASYLKTQFSRDAFDTQGRAIGERWKRLSPATVARKARSGFTGGPLIATGRMRNSFQTIVSSDQAIIYNTAPYFKYHQSRAPRFRLPRRVMMALGDNQKAEVVRFFQLHLRESMRRRQSSTV